MVPKRKLIPIVTEQFNCAPLFRTKQCYIQCISVWFRDESKLPNDVIHAKRMHGKEYHSPMYACFPDNHSTELAWISYLLVKLYKIGLHVMIVKAIMFVFDNVFSCFSCEKSNNSNV